MSPDRSAEVVSTLHAILKPFLLRRLKADVTDLPPKKEYVLYAPLTKGQKEIYEQIVSGGIREYLVRGANKSKAKLEIDMHAPRKTRGDGAATAYDPDEDDDEYFERLERGDDGARIDPVKRKAAGDVHNIGLEYQHKATRMFASLLLDPLLTIFCVSQTSQQYEAAKQDNATAQDLFASVSNQISQYHAT